MAPAAFETVTSLISSYDRVSFTLRDLKLLRFVRDHDGRVTCRDVCRHGLGCRNAADARRRLDFLVDARLGYWEFPRPAAEGGRPSRTFVLAPRKRVSTPRPWNDDLLQSLRFGLGADSDGHALAADLVNVLREHCEADARLSAAQMYRVLSQLRAALAVYATQPAARGNASVTSGATVGASPPVSRPSCPAPSRSANPLPKASAPLTLEAILLEAARLGAIKGVIVPPGF
jgi:hypothetical protein